MILSDFSAPADLVPSNSFVVTKMGISWQFLTRKLLRVSDIRHRISLASWRSFPIAAEIHPTSRCNLQCKSCSFRKRNRSLSEFSLQEVLSLLMELQGMGTHSVLFSGGGDPLMWPHWQRLLDSPSIAEQNLLLSVATNGVALAECFDSCHLAKFTIFQVSVHGYDQTIFNRVTGTTKCSQFLKSLAFLFRHKPETLQCTAKITVDNLNYEDWKPIIAQTLQWPFDAIVIKVAGRFEGHRGLLLNRGQIHRLANDLADYNWPSHFPETFSSLEDPTGRERLLCSNRSCKVIRMGLYALVRSDGSVFPCVASADDNSACLGSIRESDLKGLWVSERHGQVVMKLLKKCGAEGCRFEVCNILRYNPVLKPTMTFSNDARDIRIPLL